MPGRFLIVEDNPTNLALMAYLLKAFGHEVLMASDGAEALERIRIERPDVVLMDLQMPAMDGYEAGRRIKSDPALRSVPLVAVTAFAMVGDRDRVLKSGFDGYLAKPITPETFVSEMEVFLPAHLRSNGGLVPASASVKPHVRATILVVDDCPVNLELARESLRPFGYAVVTAASVEEALRAAREQPPDLILSDLHMPGRSGYDLFRVIKADEGLRSIPFLFVSSTVCADEDRAVGLAMGAVRFIVRPIELDAFITEIDACLRMRRLAEAQP